jgi:cell division control protein 6
LIGPLEILTDKYDPPKLLHRDKEQEKIADIIASLVREAVPTHLFINGRSGSGKTATVTHVLDHIQYIQNLSRPTKSLMVNCRNPISHHGLLARLIEQLEPGTSFPNNTSWNELSTRLVTACRKAQANIVIVLDEVDRLVKKERGCDALYTLANLSSELKGSSTTVTIFTISNDLHYGERLDQSVLSRLQVEKLHFPPYNREQLTEILRDRAKLVFAEDGMEPGVMEYCATIAARTHGDARHALGLLHKAAIIAGREGAREVTMQHTLSARSALEHDVLVEAIHGLTDHEKLILLTIAKLFERHNVHDRVTTGMVLEGYRKVCNAVGVEPQTLQSVSHLLSDIASQGFISSEVKSLGFRKGRTTVIHIAVPVEPTIEILQEEHIIKVARSDSGWSTLS